MKLPKSFQWNTATDVRFLVDGAQFYPEMLKAIENARHYILMEMYLFESSSISDKFIAAFIKASHRGVIVKLILDAYGCLKLSTLDREKLTNSGVQIKFYNPLRLSNLKQNLFRTHRKYLILDGEKVFIGGVGLTDDFVGKNGWRETVIEVKGNIVIDWQILFDDYFKSPEITEIPQKNSVPARPTTAARLAYTKGGTQLEIKKVLLNRINKSNHYIWFASAYFIPSDKIRKALRKAAVNGKDVRLLLPGPITDHPAVRFASRRYYKKLLKYGVRIFEYQGRFTHTKMVLIDDWFTIGSSNMDRWNFRWNMEANQEIESENFTMSAREILINDFGNSKEINYSQWLRRSKYQRFKEWLWGKVDLWITSRK